MHTGSYGLMSGDGAAQAGPGGQEDIAATWPVWSGSVPPLAEGFTVRPDSVPGLEATLTPGATVALVPDQVRHRPGLAGVGRQDPAGPLLRRVAVALPGVDVLTWVVATSRASVLSGFVQAAAAMGAGDAGDAESVAVRYADWLSKTTGRGSSCSTTCVTRRTWRTCGRPARQAGC